MKLNNELVQYMLKSETESWIFSLNYDSLTGVGSLSQNMDVIGHRLSNEW